MNAKGFISQIMAGVIIVIAIVAFAITFTTIGRVKKGSFQSVLANQRAAKKLEALMNTSFLTLANGDFTDAPGAVDWNVKWTIEDVGAAPSRIKKITVIAKQQEKASKANQPMGDMAVGIKYNDF